MPLKSVFILVWLSPAFLVAQVKNSENIFFKTQGTIMMAIKAKDGIIIVADSRVAYTSSLSNDVLAYHDGLPKIYPLKKFAIAVAGDFSDGEFFIRRIISDFDDSKPSYRTPEECLFKFGLFTKEKYPAYFTKLDSNILICAGYCPEQCIAVLVNNKTYTVAPKSWASNVDYEMDSLHLFNPPPNGTSKQLADLAESAMAEYIKIFHKENEMGGLFSVLKISFDNSTRWSKNDFTGNDFFTECEAARAIFTDKIRLVYTTEKNKELLREMIKVMRKRCAMAKSH
ncbi:MAG TPA: hypothetical protein VNV85_05650 [Puia sp.]|jgi:hypothetical protein|nr:hypothetical protein [Puia sp.]